MSWVQLLKRVFAIDITTCQQCGGPLPILAAIEDPAVIIKILSHMGLPTRAPPRAPARLDAFLQTAYAPPGFRFSVGADTPPLPSSPTPTPQWRNRLTRSWKNGPCRTISPWHSRLSDGNVCELTPQRGL